MDDADIDALRRAVQDCIDAIRILDADARANAANIVATQMLVVAMIEASEPAGTPDKRAFVERIMTHLDYLAQASHPDMEIVRQRLQLLTDQIGRLDG
jgi:hypothetical protein